MNSKNTLSLFNHQKKQTTAIQSPKYHLSLPRGKTGDRGLWFTLFLCAALLFTSCTTEFDNHYNKVTKERIQPLEFVFSPADNSAGDTVSLTASFSGKNFNAAAIAWNVSWQVVSTPFSSEAFEEESLLPYMIGSPIITTSGATQSVTVTFFIPDSIIYNNRGIPDDWADLVTYYIPDFDPAALGLPTTKDSLLMILDTISALDAAQKALIPRQYGELLNSMSQILTVQYDIYADVADFKRIKTRQSVRYHNSLDGVNGIYINQVPTLDSIVLFKSPKSSMDSFNPANGTHASYPLVNDTLTIPLVGDSVYWLGIYASPLDSALTFEAASQGNAASLEKYSSYFFYDDHLYNKIHALVWQGYYDDDGFNYYHLDLDESLAVGDIGTFWVSVIDSRAGEANRPAGRVLQEITVVVE